MGWIKRISLKKTLFTMMCLGLLLASFLSYAAFLGCSRLSRSIARSGTMITLDSSASPPYVTVLPEPSASAMRIAAILDILQILLPIFIFTIVILLTSVLFYRIKLEEPLHILKNGAERIMENDLDFIIPTRQNADELGQLCNAFEKMRESLLINNQTLWRQSEERKRLNSAFAHDLRNPLTVLKGTVKLLRKGIQDEQTLNRLESYTLRIEQYIDSMSNIQRLEQIAVRKRSIPCSQLYSELADTAKLLVPALSCEISLPNMETIDVGSVDMMTVGLDSVTMNTVDMDTVDIDSGLFMTVAENLIANAVRFAKKKLWISFNIQDSFLLLSVTDDGPGFPDELIQNGPKPFGKLKENAEHFGMGLYSCQIICLKHGGKLVLENIEGRGAKATAVFSKTLSVS